MNGEVGVNWLFGPSENLSRVKKQMESETYNFL